MLSNSDDLDLIRCGPEECVVIIPGHKARYDFTQLVPYFGWHACDRIAHGWEVAFFGYSGDTAYAVFKTFRTVLLHLALNFDIPSSRYFEAYEAVASGRTCSPKIWAEFVTEIQSKIADLEDTSIIDGAVSSREGYQYRVRSAFEKLGKAGVFPEIVVPIVTNFKVSRRIKSPTLAELSNSAGRVSFSADSGRDRLKIIEKENDRVSGALRAAHLVELEAEWEVLNRGRRMCGRTDLPTVKQLDDALIYRSSLRGVDARADRAPCRCLDGDDEYRLAIAVKFFRAVYHEGYVHRCPKGSMRRLFETAGGRRFVERFLEPSFRALSNAFHVVVGDTGFEMGSTLAMTDNPFTGAVVRNRQIVRSFVGSKGRAKGARRDAAAAESVETRLPVKLDNGQLSAIKLIERWLEWSAPLRRSAPARVRKYLWIYRNKDGRIARAEPVLISKSLREFRERHENDPTIGGLKVTTRVLRRTKHIQRSIDSDFDHSLLQALSGHSSAELPFAYLTDAVINVILQERIRKYVDQADAVLFSGLDDLAQRLGVHVEDLEKRRMLGLENGLAGLLPKIPVTGDAKPRLSFKIQGKFVPSDAGMTALCKAGMAIDRLWKKMAGANPQRFLVGWIPWMAVIGALAASMAKSRFNVRFQRIKQKLSALADQGKLQLPVLW
ncbi:hypothetical protein ELI30_08775 [Rhizobium leguminosarum]|uniref:hypothetical protein n=1 Tax=Rhizobium leguminosarum TaxID=384 RepID=UPI0010314503|nr:hypothetical protein [Rhizobium leguminosarum]TAV48389.1 hypothetical protein ELI32_09230 [Rhizobium leguminosarum]TAV57889.1 hypothetical protein ELI31_08760 [Rhizobium leguminosarum]TAV68829.1 hypothetical protein ELI30_08775 [Rhizobium leguminosarum]